MPFGKRALLALANDGDELYSRSMAYGIDYERSPSYENETSRLHAVWQRSNPTRGGVHHLLNVSGMACVA